VVTGKINWSIVWAHNKLNFSPAIQPRALSITQGRAVGLTHYLLGGIGTTWAFFLARNFNQLIAT
jgi:photosystem I P700 chlorophyll a apoprotein A1